MRPPEPDGNPGSGTNVGIAGGGSASGVAGEVTKDTATGVVVLGHGSRAPEAGRLLEWIAQRLAERFECPVAPASLQFNSPTLEESCRRLAAAGTGRIVIAPYFLFDGNHLQKDIPGEVERLGRELPGVELILAGSLGPDERLVDVMKGRIMEVFNGTGRRVEQGLPQHPIEAQSFDIIDDLLHPADPAAAEYQVTRRVVHATGDPALAGEVIFSPGAIEAAMQAIEARANIICDVNMVAAGVEPTAAKMGIAVSCAIAGDETKALAEREGITRGAAGIRRAADSGLLDGAVVAIGNAPTALLECLRVSGAGQARPALIVGVPVGFVDAAESKQALAGSGLPQITLPGYRGGSNVAVAIINALMRLAAAGNSVAAQKTETVQKTESAQNSEAVQKTESAQKTETARQAEHGPEGPSL